MLSEALSLDAEGNGGSRALSPRANIALLTLQLRAALQEAAAAEADEAASDDDAARAQLRERAVPLIEKRRAELDAILARERAEASAKVAAAQRAVFAETPLPQLPPTTTVVVPAVVPTPPLVDADAFARGVAAAFASILDDRLNERALLPVPAPTPARRSFWRNARHPDVLLLAFATVIVLVVLAAWMA